MTLASQSSKDEASETTDEAIICSISQIGLLLKSEREKQCLSTAFVAASLKIGEEQLIALENGDQTSLPEPVFVKAMARRVAERLNIDAGTLEKILQEKKDEESFNLFKDLNNNNNESKAHKSIKSIFTRSKIFTLIILSIVSLLIFKVYRDNSKNKFSLIKEESIGYQDLIKDNRPSKEIIISSLRPSKAKIINNLGEVLFEGIIKYPLKYSLDQGIEIYAYRPNLIEISSEGNKSTVLSSFDDLKWHNLSSFTLEPNQNP